MARNEHRISEWGIQDHVEWLLTEGVKDPSVIAKRLNDNPEVATAIGHNKVMPFDVRAYCKHRLKQQADAQARALSHSPQASLLMEQARSATGRLMESVTMLEGLSEDITDDVRTARDNWRDAQESGDPEKLALVPFYDKQVKALKDVREMIDKTISRAESPAIQAIIKANTVEQNVSHGMDFDEVLASIKGMSRHMRCGHCGSTDFDDRELLGAFSRARGDAARDDVIDAEAYPSG